MTGCNKPCSQGRYCDKFDCAGLHDDTKDWCDHPAYIAIGAVVLVLTIICSTLQPWHWWVR